MMHSFRPELWDRLYPASLREHALWLRRLSLPTDDNPCTVLDHLDHPLVDRLCDPRPISSVERVQTFEALAYGDASTLLSAPGTGLPGVIMRELGSPAQQDRFFNAVSKRKARTFLAVTEPAKGTDAGGMSTRVDREGILNGEKWLVGHAATGDIGVVMARTGPGPLSLGAVLLTPESLADADRCERHRLPMLGLRGALLGHMVFKDLPLGADALLGAHLHPLQRGMMAMIRTFSRFRPCVAAMAVGHGQAMADYARAQMRDGDRTSALSQLAAWDMQLAGARQLVRLAAEEVDANPESAPHVPLCKVTATQVCEAIADAVPGLLGTAALLDHPWLEKAVRDARAFEYMEGTTGIHLGTAGTHHARSRAQSHVRQPHAAYQAERHQ